VSGSGGAFSLPRSFPGDYVASAAHDSWHIARASQPLSLGFGASEADLAFQVAGFTVSGLVQSEGEPLAGADVVLLAPAGGANAGVSCVGVGGDAALHSHLGTPVLCASRTDAQGRYVFHRVPCGAFRVAALYRRPGTSYEVHPQELPVSVLMEDLHVQQPFQVLGFSVAGRVVNAAGRGVAGAAILVDGAERALSDAHGRFKIERITSGKYTVRASKPHHVFSELAALQITPALQSLPDILLTRLHVCGRVESEEVVADRQVVLSRVGGGGGGGGGGGELSVRADRDGRFCFEVEPGHKYTVRPQAAASETAKGVTLAPAHRTVTVEAEPVLNVDFMQARVSISGRVKCLTSPCDAPLAVALSPLGGVDAKRLATVEEDGSWTLQQVVPGRYAVAVQHEGWCWDKSSIEIAVDSTDVRNVDFRQTGFVLAVSSSHELSLNISRAGAPPDAPARSVKLGKGANRVCLDAPGQYVLAPVSCYRFERERFAYDSREPRAVHLEAVEFMVKGAIVVPLKGGATASDGSAAGATEHKPLSADALPRSISLQVRAEGDPAGEAQVVKAVRLEAAERNQAHQVVYEYTAWSPADRSVTVYPLVNASHGLLFYPRSRSLVVSDHGCQTSVDPFQGRPGAYASGRVSPPVEGVTISVASEGAAAASLQVVTDAKGEYLAGPLYDDLPYTLSASAPGYHFVEDEAHKGHFRAVKLGELAIEVRDAAGAPVKDVLLSLSGGSSYRSNNVTDASGDYLFAGLFPGSYFLRPHLKEYRFEPPTLSIELEQATRVRRILRATRVAFSVFGAVRSLTGEAEAQVIVEAAEGSEGGRVVEETLTDAAGAYRLRGLVPHKTYHVRVRPSQGAAHKVERAAPAHVAVTMRESDAFGIDFVAYRRPSRFDITGVVSAPRDQLATLTVELLRPPGNALVKAQPLSKNIDFFEFTSLPADAYVVRLRSSLSPRAFDVRAHEVPVALAGHTHLALSFAAEPRSQQQELASGNLFGLVLAVALALAIMYRQQVLDALRALDEWRAQRATAAAAGKPAKRG
jgi:protocatechuate 3,4-dioxygenase beta subunit